MSQSFEGLGTSLDITAQNTSNIVGAENSMAIVGGADMANTGQNVVAGEVTPVTNSADAARYFGEASELSVACDLAFTNGISTVYAVPVAETGSSTESFSGSQTGTLANIPFDPRLHTEHDITVQDTTDGESVTVNYVYGTPSQPSNSNTMNLNPVTGEWAADASSAYDVTYSYGDYESAIAEAVSTQARYVCVLTESEQHKLTLQTELSNHAQNFDFKRGVVGAKPDINAGDVGSYEPATDDWRMVEVAPSRGTRGGRDVRTAAGVAALLATQPVDASGSVTYDAVKGLSNLSEAYLANTAQGFDRTLALTQNYEIVNGVTTSTNAAFADIYQAEIVEEVAVNLYDVIRSFRGRGNFSEMRDNLATHIKFGLESFATNSPPLLATGSDGSGRPYMAEVSAGASDEAVNVVVGIEPVSIMKQVNLNVNVGEVVTFDGASTDAEGTASGSSDSGSGGDGSGDGSTGGTTSGTAS